MDTTKNGAEVIEELQNVVQQEKEEDKMVKERRSWTYRRDDNASKNILRRETNWTE